MQKFCYSKSQIIFFIIYQAIYLFGLGIPLFIDDKEHPYHIKWSLWVVHRLVLTAVYGCILCMYHSRWRERLPGKSSFHGITYHIHYSYSRSTVINDFYHTSCSKTSILQIYHHHVHRECHSSLCLWTYWERGRFWILVTPLTNIIMLTELLRSNYNSYESQVIWCYNRLLPRLLSAPSILHISS